MTVARVFQNNAEYLFISYKVFQILYQAIDVLLLKFIASVVFCLLDLV